MAAVTTANARTTPSATEPAIKNQERCEALLVCDAVAVARSTTSGGGTGASSMAAGPPLIALADVFVEPFAAAFKSLTRSAGGVAEGRTAGGPPMNRGFGAAGV